MERSLVRASKFLSLVLRHQPERVGLALDRAGWARTDDLLAACRRAGIALDRDTLRRIVEENDKRRFAFSPDGALIRASQGHSVPVDLGLEARTPPETLYHGTAARAVEPIRREGLWPGSRLHVHLSADSATARAVGSRHGAPVVLQVAAGRMHRAGCVFLQAENGVWLTSFVAAEYIQFRDPGPQPGSAAEPDRPPQR